MKVELDGLNIDAIGMGGIESCYQIPAWNLNLDIGRCPRGAEKQGVLLLTHAHIDHAAGLPYFVSIRKMLRHGPTRVYCPVESEDKLQAILDLWASLQADADQCQLIGLKAQERIELKPNLYAESFLSPHRIATRGYFIYSVKKALKPEYQNTAQSEIAELARQGKTVSEERETLELCYPGDTQIELLDSNPLVAKARRLILECTFVGNDVPPKRAQKGGHIHLNHLAERAELLENQTILLTHFSRRHSPKEIEDEMSRKLPAQLRQRIQLLFPER